MENKMREVAEILGVPFTEDIDEPKCFEVCLWSIWRLAFICERGLVWFKETNGTFERTALAGILIGDIEYRITPFQPELGGKYWCVQFCGIGNHKNIYVDEFTHSGDIHDYQNISIGNCFQCQSAADKMKYEIYKKITGKVWE